ncbi:hypothetical protein NBRC116592_30680 [Colwellia sp. KU-HH00111]
MIKVKHFQIAFYVGLFATIIGLIAFSVSWHSWQYFDGPLPGYDILLFPGNLTLIYFWHPIFTEEVDFWPKLAMLLFGQCFVVSCFVMMYIVVKSSLLFILRQIIRSIK